MPVRFLLSPRCWVVALLCLLPGFCAVAAEPSRWLDASTMPFTNDAAPVAAGGTAIAQDGAGFLWLGTQSGLVRWDGYAFQRFTGSPGPGELRDKFVTCLHVDDRGRLWVGTNAGGLARFDPASDGFVSYPIGAGGVRSAKVGAIVSDGRGGLWIGGDAGLDHVAPDDRVVAPSAERQTAQGLPASGIEALLLDPAGTLWVGTRRGLFRRAAGAADFVELPLPLHDGRRAEVAKLLVDGRGQVWVGTWGRGAFVVEPGGHRAAAVQESGGLRQLAAESVVAMAEAAPGEVWLGVHGRGLLVVAADGTTRRVRQQRGLTQSLLDDDVLALHRDRSGLVWVATNGGLSRHDPRQRAVLTLWSDPLRPASLTDGHVTSLLARPDGRVWAGAGTEGIDILDPRLGRVGRLRADGDHPTSALPAAIVLSMDDAFDGGVWIGTRLGLYLADGQGRGVRRIAIPGRDPAATVKAVRRDRKDGVLWIGGVDGLWALQVGDSDAPRVLRHVEVSAFGTRIVALQRGAGNDLWIGTLEGLVRYDVATGTVERVPKARDDAEGVPLGVVSSMLVDARGRLWASSAANAIVRHEGRDAAGRPRFRRIGPRDGLPDVIIDKLLADARGRIWASTDDGIAVVDPDTLSVRVLRQSEGVALKGHWTESGAVTTGGELLFGGQGGVTVVRPDESIVAPQSAPVVVTGADVGGAPLPVGRFEPVRGAVPPIEVPPGARGVWVEFAALDFSAPERNRYAYRLDGFDTDWTATDPKHRRASYTNLPPGRYTLQLRGSNRDGIWSAPISLPLHVQPAWYQTTGFRGLVLVAGLLAILALVHARTVSLQRRRRELEAIVAERTRDLRQRSDELRESQRQLEKIAYSDSLTGLPNRRLFTDELRRQAAQAQRGGPPFVLLLIDLDGFKSVNDLHGHDAGDALLVAIADRLRTSVREADRVARLGGDEFAVVLSQDPTPDDVDAVCRRIVSSVAEPVRFKRAWLTVGASLGLAASSQHGTDPERLYKAADLALYAAKRGGRSTWRWHEGAVTQPLELE